ncbi:MAG: hypothetical protein ACK559_08335 [bacterium]
MCGWVGWLRQAQLSPHPPTQGLEWSHVVRQHPYPVLALQSTYLGECGRRAGGDEARSSGIPHR